MRNALFLSIGLALSFTAAAADNERCIVSFAAAQQNVCNGKISPLNRHVRTLASPDAAKASTLRLVKFDSPIDDTRRAAVESLGAQILGYAPFNAYIVRMAPALDARARAIDGVIWSGPLLPAFKIDPNIANELEFGNIARELGTDELEISLAEGSSRNSVQNALHSIAGLNFVRFVESGPDTRVIATFERARLRAAVEQLALSEDIIAIGLRMPAQLENSQADWLHQSNVNTPTPLRPVFDRGIYGCGQVIGEFDTGVYVDHCSFKDASQTTPVSNCTSGASCPTIAAPNNNARKVVAYYKWSGAPGNTPEDDHGHGTHVAGSILGNNPANAVDCANFTTPGGTTDLDGTAPGAKLVMQESGGNLAYLNNAGGNPYHAAKTAYDTGARLHSNSWSASCGNGSGGCIANCTVPYSALSRDADRVAKDNPDLFLLFAAGNSGTGCANGNNVGAPGNAKNVATIGATGRGTAGNDMAGFSARGPTADVRTKPDVTAQGVGIVSADRNACGTRSMSGTSMATPTAAGLAALVREYLQGGFYPTGQRVAQNAMLNPSGALIKAILISGAATMTGTGANTSPGTSQGFGRILLDNSLYFNGDASHIYLHDAPQGLATNGVDTHTLTVSAGVPLNVTLTWSDEAAAVNANPALVNALRLEVVAPNGDVWTQKLPPNATVDNANPIQDTTTANYDNRNNVHRIRLDNPAAGNYQIRVRGVSVPLGPQKYAIAATGSFQATVTPDFALQTTPTSREVCAGAPVNYAIGVQSIAAYSQPVTLSVAGLPGSGTGTFTPSPVTPAWPPATSQLAITGTAGTASGSYSLVVTGTSGTPAVTRTAGVTLTVTGAAPSTPSPTSPAHQATGVITAPTFRWPAVQETTTYRFQLSTSPTFSTVLVDEVLSAPTFTPTTLLNSETQYYWRVYASNICGTSAPSSTFTFRTANVICHVANAPIPDEDPNGVTDILHATTTGPLTGLRLWLDVTHSFVGDLTLKVTKGATTATLVSNPGPIGCGGNDINVIVDDAASLSLMGNCRGDPNTAYITGESYRPLNSLSAFTGTELSGDWSLHIDDNAAEDTGQLNRWCLLPASPAGPTDVIFENDFE